MAYKGFRKDLTCTMGRGTFQYAPGVWYEEKTAKCANSGFHATYNPLDVLEYYSRSNDRYFVVELDGNIDEDAVHSRISAPRIRLVREITIQQLLAAGVLFMSKNPKLPWSDVVKKDKGNAEQDGYVIVRGKDPIASGKAGDLLFLFKDDTNEIAIYEVGVDVAAGVMCDVKGEIHDD